MVTTALEWKDPLERVRQHALITKTAIKDVPPVGYGANDSPALVSKRMVRVKLFSPYSRWAWYICEFDADDGTAFGLVDGHEREWGYFNVFELAQVKGAVFQGSTVELPLIERDLYWKPRTVAELEKELVKSR